MRRHLAGSAAPPARAPPRRAHRIGDGRVVSHDRHGFGMRAVFANQPASDRQVELLFGAAAQPGMRVNPAVRTHYVQRLQASHARDNPRPAATGHPAQSGRSILQHLGLPFALVLLARPVHQIQTGAIGSPLPKQGIQLALHSCARSAHGQARPGSQARSGLPSDPSSRSAPPLFASRFLCTSSGFLQRSPDLSCSADA